MRLSTFTSLFCTALTVCAQTTSGNTSTSDDLLLGFQQLSDCATTCVATTLSSSPCAFGDFECLCNDKAYIERSGSCIQKNCTVKEALTAQGWQKEVCKAPVRDNGHITRIGGITMMTVAALCIMCRFLARWRIQNSSIGWDDWTILMSFILLIPSTAILHIMTSYGMGQDVWMVPFDDITQMFKLFYVEQYLYQAIIVLTKISIVFLYLRIFPKEVSPRFRQLCWTVIVALVTYLLAFYIYFALECKPLSFFWNIWDGEHEGHCNNMQLAIYVNSGFNITFDLVVFCLPVPKLIKLQVRDTRRKVAAVLTFLVGLFVTVCTLIRLQYLSEFSKITNPTYHYQDIAIWSGTEAHIGVICACMPTVLGPLMYFFRETVGSKLSSFPKSNTDDSSRSRTLDKKSIRRLPSKESHDLEMNWRTPSHGGIEKTVETSVHNIKNERESGDGLELPIQGPMREGMRSYWRA